MLIEGEPLLYDKGNNDEAATPFTVYSKPEKSDEDREYLRKNNAYADTIDFVSDYTIFTRRVTNLGPGETTKYTIILWIEGWDPDCDDSIIGEQVKTSIDFVGY
jgi:hypothetical protein